MPAQKRDLKFIIFSLIGIFNTVFDLALYLVIYNLTNSVIIANTAATTAALIGSYLLNSRLTFKSKNWTVRSFALFVAVTIFGLWVLQTGIIYLVTPLVHHAPEHIWQLLGGLEHTAKVITPKLLATVVTFVWNYVWYSKVIFKNDSPSQRAKIALEEL